MVRTGASAAATEFTAEVDRHMHDLRGSRLLPGFDAIRLPGDAQRRRVRPRRDRFQCRRRKRDQYRTLHRCRRHRALRAQRLSKFSYFAPARCHSLTLHVGMASMKACAQTSHHSLAPEYGLRQCATELGVSHIPRDHLEPSALAFPLA